MSHQQNFDAYQIANAFAAQFVAYAAQQQSLLVEAKPRPAMNALQSKIYDAVDDGTTSYAKIARLIGMTLVQTRTIARGMLFANMLATKNGALATA